jgi:hypothetical protein
MEVYVGMQRSIISPYATLSQRPTPTLATRKRSQFLVVQKVLIAPSTTHASKASPSRSTLWFVAFFGS